VSVEARPQKRTRFGSALLNDTLVPNSAGTICQSLVGSCGPYRARCWDTGGSSPTRSAWLRDRRVGQKMLDLNVCGVEYRSEGRLVSRHI
jgi:hypothetical protein